MMFAHAASTEAKDPDASLVDGDVLAEAAASDNVPVDASTLRDTSWGAAMAGRAALDSSFLGKMTVGFVSGSGTVFGVAVVVMAPNAAGRVTVARSASTFGWTAKAVFSILDVAPMDSPNTRKLKAVAERRLRFWLFVAKFALLPPSPLALSFLNPPARVALHTIYLCPNFRLATLIDLDSWHTSVRDIS
jgi:hypothetical protein